MDGTVAGMAGERVARPLAVGLVNNMGQAARAAVHEQFLSALSATRIPVRLYHLTLNDAQDEAHGLDILDGEIDGLIVTGMEPSASDLRQEWLWDRLAGLHDWCEQYSVPVIWSCLSAHAAVLHRDGISRRRLDRKLSGMFGCARAASSHPLLKGMPDGWACPHSRHNGLEESELVACGYEVLSRSHIAGVDIFARGDGMPFFYFQGHPEYRPDTLLREYLRDTRRFLAGETATRPAVPAGYLDIDDEQWLVTLCDMDLSSFNSLSTAVANMVRIRENFDSYLAITRLFTNWLDIVRENADGRTNAVNAGAAAVALITSLGMAHT